MYRYECYFCQEIRTAENSFCSFCGFDSPYGSERFWRFLTKGVLIELGTGYGATSLYAASQGITVYTVDNLADAHPIPEHDLITAIEYDIFEGNFWTPPEKADMLLVDINTDTKEVIDFYKGFVKPDGIIIIDGEYANCYRHK